MPASSGYRPYAAFPDRWLALLAAAALPGTGRDPLFLLNPEPGPEGFALHLDSGEVVGHCENFDQPLTEALQVLAFLLRVPLSLANALEAAGSITLDRTGAILDARVATPSPDIRSKKTPPATRPAAAPRSISK